METLGQRLKFLRDARHWSQRYCADMLGMSQGGYVRYEKDMTYPDEIMTEKFVRVFGTSREFLLGITSPIEHLPKHLQEFVSDPRNEKFIMRAYAEYILQREA